MRDMLFREGLFSVRSGSDFHSHQQSSLALRPRVVRSLVFLGLGLIAAILIAKWTWHGIIAVGLIFLGLAHDVQDNAGDNGPPRGDCITIAQTVTPGTLDVTHMITGEQYSAASTRACLPRSPTLLLP